MLLKKLYKILRNYRRDKSRVEVLFSFRYNLGEYYAVRLKKGCIIYNQTYIVPENPHRYLSELGRSGLKDYIIKELRFKSRKYIILC